MLSQLTIFVLRNIVRVLNSSGYYFEVFYIPNVFQTWYFEKCGCTVLCYAKVVTQAASLSVNFFYSDRISLGACAMLFSTLFLEWLNAHQK